MNTPQRSPQQTATVNATMPSSDSENTILMTSIVVLESPHGQRMRDRAFLDSGSTTSIVSNWVVQQLQLKRKSDETSLSGIYGFKGHSSHSTSLVVRPIDSHEHAFLL